MRVSFYEYKCSQKNATILRHLQQRYAVEAWRVV